MKYEMEYEKETMQMPCGPDPIGTEASTEVRWAGNGQLCLQTID